MTYADLYAVQEFYKKHKKDFEEYYKIEKEEDLSNQHILQDYLDQIGFYDDCLSIIQNEFFIRLDDVFKECETQLTSAFPMSHETHLTH